MPVMRGMAIILPQLFFRSPHWRLECLYASRQMPTTASRMHTENWRGIMSPKICRRKFTCARCKNPYSERLSFASAKALKHAILSSWCKSCRDDLIMPVQHRVIAERVDSQGFLIRTLEPADCSPKTLREFTATEYGDNMLRGSMI